MKSIIQNKKECYLCKTTVSLNEHHIFFGTANRKLSEKDGLKVFLCLEHHKGQAGVHNNRDLDVFFKQIAQKRWEEFYEKTEEEFIKRYGKSFLGGENEKD